MGSPKWLPATWMGLEGGLVANGEPPASAVALVGGPTAPINTLAHEEPANVITFGPRVQLTGPQITPNNGIASLTDQISSLEIVGNDDDNAAHHNVAGNNIIQRLFIAAPEPLLPNPVQEDAPAPALPTIRHSARLAKKATTIPVSLRAQHRLIRQLEIVQDDEPINDDAVQRYIHAFAQPLPSHVIAACRALTHIEDESFLAAMGMMAAEESTNHA
ncbi:hypothetical protein E2562_029973 [Oryza meyeriana var. granulata]|uniref:Uncharacterized protein n=1 Tax=Oryza meyeriana var. granulata TaxID=110450 RepID=A0A6G1CUR3_9ORYZ|nr:hypothetical protein E2562_029973 [Oryza meyeriana var. granulata]